MTEVLKKRLLGTLIITSLFLIISTDLLAKRFHTSMTQVSFQSEQEKTEIAITLFTHDMERLRQHLQAGNSVEFPANGNIRQELRADREFEKAFVSYLGKVFHVADQKSGKPLSWNFIHVDYGIYTSEVYLEIPNRKPEELDFKQNLLFEIFPDQVNTLQIKSSKREASSQVFRSQTKTKEDQRESAQLRPQERPPKRDGA